MEKELYQFLVADYFATGEGRTVSILITRAYPSHEDYVNPSYFDDNGKWHFDETTKNTAEERAIREFQSEFGDWYVRGVEVLNREKFFKKVGHMMPDFVSKLLNDDDQPGNFAFRQQFHMNYS